MPNLRSLIPVIFLPRMVQLRSWSAHGRSGVEAAASDQYVAAHGDQRLVFGVKCCVHRDAALGERLITGSALIVAKATSRNYVPVILSFAVRHALHRCWLRPTRHRRAGSVMTPSRPKRSRA